MNIYFISTHNDNRFGYEIKQQRGLTMGLSRRTFIKTSTVAAAAAAAQRITGQTMATPKSTLQLRPGPGNKWPGRVAINFDKNVVSSSFRVNNDRVKEMVDESICFLTDQTEIGAAWKKVFPAELSTASKIAIKIGTANTGKPCPHWASVRAITDGLKSMVIDGTPFPAENVTIYDMDFMGGMTAAGFSATNFPDIAIKTTKLVNGDDSALKNRGYASVLNEADYLINVFSPRGHTYPPEGSRFTLGFKNHIGTYAEKYMPGDGKGGPDLHNPPGSGGTQDNGIYKTLMENLRDMNCSGAVYNKNILSVCSGIFAMDEGHGPGGEADDYSTYAKSMDDSIIASTAASTTIMLSTDPISIEMQSIKIMRINGGGGYAIEDLPPYLLASAGYEGKQPSPAYNIGIVDEEAMDIRRVINGVTMIDADRGGAGKLTVSGKIVTAQQQGSSTFIEFVVRQFDTHKTAAVEIVSLKGEKVYAGTMAIKGARNHFSWNNRSETGANVSRGTYVVRIQSGGQRLTKRLVIR